MTSDAPKSATVLVEVVDSIHILTLNRPDKLNAANLEVQETLLACLQAVAGDKTARALILTGAGRAFSAGGDRDILKQIAATGRADQHDALGAVHIGTIRCMLGLTIPAIASVPGPAVGYAAGLVALCDFVVMGEHGFLCDPHVTFGVAATTAAQLIWPRRASEAKVREILMSGRKVGAREAVEIGLANRFCSAGEEMTTALDMAKIFTALPPTGIAGTKQAFNQPILRSLEEMLAAHA